MADSHKPTKSIRLLQVLLSMILIYYHALHDEHVYHVTLSNSALNRRNKRRFKWSIINQRISNNHFRRMFQIPRHCFQKLCNTIIKNIGESRFKSEQYIDTFLDQPYSPFISRQVIMYAAHVKTSGCYIYGEIKLGIVLRMLAGGDALDLSVLFDISPHSCKEILYYVLENWIIEPNLGGMDMKAYLENEEEMERVSSGFSKRSNGIVKGAISALDGWLVKIARPSWSIDKLRNMVSFFSRKVIYALNVQCLVDHQKNVL